MKSKARKKKAKAVLGRPLADVSGRYRVAVSVSFSADVLESLDEYARQHGLSRSESVGLALVDYLSPLYLDR